MNRTRIVVAIAIVAASISSSSAAQSEGIILNSRAAVGTSLPIDEARSVTFGNIPDFIIAASPVQTFWHPCISSGRSISFTAFSAETFPSFTLGTAPRNGVWLSRADGSLVHIESNVPESLGFAQGSFGGFAINPGSTSGAELFAMYSMTDSLVGGFPFREERYSFFNQFFQDETVFQAANDASPHFAGLMVPGTDGIYMSFPSVLGQDIGVRFFFPGVTTDRGGGTAFFVEVRQFPNGLPCGGDKEPPCGVIASGDAVIYTPFESSEEIRIAVSTLDPPVMGGRAFTDSLVLLGSITDLPNQHSQVLFHISAPQIVFPPQPQLDGLFVYRELGEESDIVPVAVGGQESPGLEPLVYQNMPFGGGPIGSMNRNGEVVFTALLRDPGTGQVTRNILLWTPSPVEVDAGTTRIIAMEGTELAPGLSVGSGSGVLGVRPVIARANEHKVLFLARLAGASFANDSVAVVADVSMDPPVYEIVAREGDATGDSLAPIFPEFNEVAYSVGSGSVVLVSNAFGGSSEINSIWVQGPDGGAVQLLVAAGSQVDVGGAIKTVQDVRMRVNTNGDDGRGQAVAESNMEYAYFAAFSARFTDGATAIIEGRIGPKCLGDLNLDGVRDGADLAELLNVWGPVTTEGGSRADFNRDEVVNGADLATLLATQGIPCP